MGRMNTAAAIVPITSRTNTPPNSASFGRRRSRFSTGMGRVKSPRRDRPSSDAGAGSFGLGIEVVRERLYGLHKPYAMPVIGYPDDIRRLGVEDLASFYRRHYAPNNAILIVAGDTTAEQVRKLAERYYGPIGSREIGPRLRPSQGGTDLPQKVNRADARVAEPRWSRLWLAPSYRVGETKYAYALQVLARLFGGSETSRS